MVIYLIFFTSLSNMKPPQQDADVKPTRTTLVECCRGLAQNCGEALTFDLLPTLYSLLFLMLIRKVEMYQNQSLSCVSKHTKDVS